MSAFIQDKAHIDALVALAVRGPSATAVSPDTAWHAPRWESSTGDWISVDHVGGSPDRISADTLGQVLWGENVRSIQYRYPDTIEAPDAMPGPIDFTPADVLIYSWPFSTPLLTAVDGLDAISGYEYQACEHPEWTNSEAYRFCDALRRSLCHVLTRGTNCWSITAEDLATYRATQLGLVTS